MYKKIVCILVMTLLITTAISAVGAMNEKEKQFLSNSHIFNTEINKGYTEVNPNGVVLWDNGMHYWGYVACQWDETENFEATTADDFQFEETTVVTDVHWIAGYFNPAEDGDFDWNISFYMDRGDGMAPGDKIYQQVFPNVEVHETFIEQFMNSLFFSYWVDLAEPIQFTGGEKYWISIQGVGIFPPQTLSAIHIPIVLHEAVWKSPYFGYPNWTDFTDAFGWPSDCCFQLTGDGEPVVPDLQCEGELNWDQIPPGTVVNSTFTVINNGDVGSMLKWEVDNESLPDWGKNWTFTWKYLEWTWILDGYFVGTSTPEEVFVEVKVPDKRGEYLGEIVLVNSDDPEDTCVISVTCFVPRTRATYNPLLKQLFERFPNAFPILRQLLGLI